MQCYFFSLFDRIIVKIVLNRVILQGRVRKRSKTECREFKIYYPTIFLFNNIIEVIYTMEFKEFSNPLEKDYDITSSYDKEETNNYVENPYDEELINLTGVLEDYEDLTTYGITYEEYIHPNAETISKVKDVLGTRKSR